jgi:hypothetical protein
VIFSNTLGASVTLNDPGSTLSHIEIDNVAPAQGIAIALSGGSASDVVATAFASNSVACELLNGSLSNAICADGGTSGAAIEADSTSAPAGSYSSAIHGVTAWATGASSDGLGVHAISDTPITLTATNTIFHGENDVGAEGPATVTLDHDSFATTSKGGGASVTAPGSATNVGAAQLVDPTHANFRELPSSPTVDTGVADAWATDIYGTQRVLGTATDIGAAELAEAPSVQATGATKITDTTAVVTGFVNAEGLATSALFQYGTTPGTGDHTLAFPAGLAAQRLAVSFKLTGLRPGKTYYVRLQATNTAGSTVSPLASFTTLPSFQGLTIRTTKARVSKTHKVRISYLCPKGTTTGCKGTLKLTLAGHTAGSAKFDVKTGKSGHATIALSKRAQATLKRHTKVTVRATAKAKDGLGRSKTTKRSISLLR